LGRQGIAVDEIAHGEGLPPGEEELFRQRPLENRRQGGHHHDGLVLQDAAQRGEPCPLHVFCGQRVHGAHVPGGEGRTLPSPRKKTRSCRKESASFSVAVTMRAGRAAELEAAATRARAAP
jgi:hypothetical protein